MHRASRIELQHDDLDVTAFNSHYGRIMHGKRTSSTSAFWYDSHRLRLECHAAAGICPNENTETPPHADYMPSPSHFPISSVCPVIGTNSSRTFCICPSFTVVVVTSWTGKGGDHACSVISTIRLAGRLPMERPRNLSSQMMATV